MLVLVFSLLAAFIALVTFAIGQSYTASLSSRKVGEALRTHEARQSADIEYIQKSLLRIESTMKENRKLLDEVLRKRNGDANGS